MLVKEVFAADVTRDIAPVIYFHEQEPTKVLAEVSEYIITGDIQKQTRAIVAFNREFTSSL
jgi:hypothetical protein